MPALGARRAGIVDDERHPSVRAAPATRQDGLAVATHLEQVVVGDEDMAVVPAFPEQQ